MLARLFSKRANLIQKQNLLAQSNSLTYYNYHHIKQFSNKISQIEKQIINTIELQKCIQLVISTNSNIFLTN